MIESRILTKEYLRVLVKQVICDEICLSEANSKVLSFQIGHGYFVERAVLQERWKALSLTQDHLLALLELSGMLRWERIHWLELLSLMAASISKVFH